MLIQRVLLEAVCLLHVSKKGYFVWEQNSDPKSYLKKGEAEKDEEEMFTVRKNVRFKFSKNNAQVKFPGLVLGTISVLIFIKSIRFIDRLRLRCFSILT